MTIYALDIELGLAPGSTKAELAGAGLAIALVVFSFNMLGDTVRDVLDPRLRGTS